MRLKYYLRGLGIGIVVTAIILTITNAGLEKPLTDAQIMERAEKLGMIRPEDADSKEEAEGTDEEDPLQVDPGEEEIQPEPGTPNGEEGSGGQPDAGKSKESGDGTEDEAEDGTEDPDAGQEPSDDQKAGDPEASGEDLDTGVGQAQADPSGDAQSQASDSEYVPVKVDQGDFSDQVCSRLMAAGLIEDAADFNLYLVSNKIDGRLRIGTHQVPKGATYEEIANILCGKN